MTNPYPLSHHEETPTSQNPHLSSGPGPRATKKQFLGVPHRYQHEYEHVPSGVLAPQKSLDSAAHVVSRPLEAAFADQPLVKTKRQRKRQWKRQQPKTTRKRVWRWAFVLATVMTIMVVVFMQANGQGGAWAADTLRAIVGPTVTAQIESWYLGLSDTTHRLQYQASGQKVKAPWIVGTAEPTAVPTRKSHVAPAAFVPLALTPIQPLVTPALAGEGVWTIQQMSLPTAHIAAQPLSARAFLRPDPIRPYAFVTLLAFDTRLMLLHMIAGTYEPGGPRGMRGAGVIPSADEKKNALLAAFNGGFKYADGQYGLQVNGVVYVPPQPKAATIAVTKEGQIILGAWGIDPHLNSNNTDLVAWRQNAALLIDHGTINPLTQDGAAWGGTILNSTFTWRSGIGITAKGVLIYAAGDSLSALTLGQALQSAGAVMAMQTDINPFWVRAFLYNQTPAGTYNVTKLNPGMQGTGFEYLNSTERDFFYVTRVAPVLPPAPRLSGLAPGQ